MTDEIMVTLPKSILLDYLEANEELLKNLKRPDDAELRAKQVKCFDAIRDASLKLFAYILEHGPNGEV